MLDDIKKNEMNEQEMDNVSGGASWGEVFDVIGDAVSNVFAPVADAAGSVVDVVEYAVEQGLKR